MHSDLVYLNGLSASLGAEMGTAVTIGGNTTINASAGMTDANGNKVFTANTASFNNGQTLTINGDGVHNVVLNFSANASFGGSIVLNGLTSDQVLFNIIGGANLTGGPALGIAGGNTAILAGTFLDPNGKISIVSATLNGRVFGGDTVNEQIVSGAQLNAPASVPDGGSSMLLLSMGVGLTVAARKKLVGQNPV